MSSPDDLDSERDWLAERWQKYAEEFGVFAPEQQPDPEAAGENPTLLYHGTSEGVCLGDFQTGLGTQNLSRRRMMGFVHANREN